MVTCARDRYYNMSSCEALAIAMKERRKDRVGAIRSLPAVLKTVAAPFAQRKTAWAKTIGGSNAEGARALCAADGGASRGTGNDAPRGASASGFLAVGYTFSSGVGDVDLLALRIDGSGNMLWAKIFGGARFERGNAICAVGDGTFVVSATTGTFGRGNCDAWTVTIDGNVAWTETVGGAR